MNQKEKQKNFPAYCCVAALMQIISERLLFPFWLN